MYSFSFTVVFVVVFVIFNRGSGHEIPEISNPPKLIKLYYMIQHSHWLPEILTLNVLSESIFKEILYT